MWKSLLLLYLLLPCSVTAAERPSSTSEFRHDPIVSYAHGAVFWGDDVTTPDTDYLLAIQHHYISKYQKQLSDGPKSSEKQRLTIDERVNDPILANGLYLDWLLQQPGVAPSSRDERTHNIVRWYYLHTRAAVPSYNQNRRDGIPAAVIDELRKDGLHWYEPLRASSASYRRACRSEGIPIPETLFDDADARWTSAGFLEEAILGPTLNVNAGTGNELWLYRSEAPEGMCLAFRRVWSVDPPEGHFDLICLGLDSIKACFFESSGIRNETELDGPVDIGGLDAGENTQVASPCTECHIGENPFIVHPADPAFEQALAAKVGVGEPGTWSGADRYAAFGVPNWPPNPPSLDLSTIYSEERCSDCHQNSWAGRFPDIAQSADPLDYERYCDVVMRGVLGSRGIPATMPLGNPGAPGYTSHKNYLLAMCEAPDEGILVDNTTVNDPSVVSPPRIVVPLYQCAEAVYIDDFLDGADIELMIDGSVIAASANRLPGPAMVSLATTLEEGDSVQARQRMDGFWSAWSHPITVSRYEVAVADGLPTPSIDPSTVYRCASRVSVRYDIPGFPFELSVNGMDSVTGVTFAGFQPTTPGRVPIEFNDEFTAVVRACDERSPTSDAVFAQRPSNDTLTEAVIHPESLFRGQTVISIGNLTHGSESDVQRETGGSDSHFQTPLPWYRHRLTMPLALSDKLVVGQQLCSFNTLPSFAQSPPVKDCNVLPAPEIADPRPGEDFVRIIEPLVGARVHVYDDDGDEIGDGSGSTITLIRALVDNESIRVVQSVGECTSNQAFMIEV